MPSIGFDATQAKVMRSFLFVPSDSERKMRKALDVGADALILDLEDAVAAEARPAARVLAANYLQGKSNVWVRINPLGCDDADADLEAVLPSAPAGIVLPKPRSASVAIELAKRLTELELANGLAEGSTRILPLCTEDPAALFSLDGYVGATERLFGMSWGAEDLAAALGANANRDAAGEWLPMYQMARSLCLLAAAAAEVSAIDTVYTNFRDADGLRKYADNARRDGFSGMLAIHPAQVEIINAAFEPSTDEIERAQRIVELFDSNPGAGTLALDGKMIDRPHLVQARRLLAIMKKNNS